MIFESLRDSATAGIVFDLLDIAAAVLAVLVVRSTTRLVARSPHAPVHPVAPPDPWVASGAPSGS